MQKVIILKGLPGSGKSYWAKKEVADHPGMYKRVNKDDLRAMLDSSHHTKANEKFVLEMRDWVILRALQEGKHVIVDDTNFNPIHEETIRKIATIFTGTEFNGKTIDAQVEVKLFDTPLDVCIARDAQRGDKMVGKGVIMDMWRKYLQPKAPEAPAYDKSLPEAIICDIDGTIAKMNGRSPFEYEKVDTDLVNQPVASILRTFTTLAESHNKTDFHILFVSGRKMSCADKTAEWLKENGIPGTLFRMRGDDDDRNDAVVKQEIYEQYIKGKYNVIFVLDDRDRVVDMWRAQGLTCLQVDYGNF